MYNYSIVFRRGNDCSMLSEMGNSYFSAGTFRIIENELMFWAAMGKEYSVVKAEIYTKGAISHNVYGFTHVDGSVITMDVVVNGQVLRTMTIAE